MKKAAIVILIFGLILTLYTGIDFVTRGKVVDIGKSEITLQKNHGLAWSPMIGMVMTMIGCSLYLLARKKNAQVHRETYRF